MQPYSFMFNSCTEWIMARSNRISPERQCPCGFSDLDLVLSCPLLGPHRAECSCDGMSSCGGCCLSPISDMPIPKMCWLSPHYCLTWSAWSLEASQFSGNHFLNQSTFGVVSIGTPKSNASRPYVHREHIMAYLFSKMVCVHPHVWPVPTLTNTPNMGGFIVEYFHVEWIHVQL